MVCKVKYFINGLKSRNDEIRLETAFRLQAHVSTELQECSSEKCNKFMDELTTEFFEMLATKDVIEIKGALLGVVSLMEVFKKDGKQVSQLSIRLRDLLMLNDIGVLEIVTMLIGRLGASVPGNKGNDLVAFHVGKAFDWLQDRSASEYRRRAAVLLLREVARRLPTVFYPKVPVFFSGIFNVIFDTQLGNRECAVRAVSAAFNMLVKREMKDTGYQPPYFWICFEAVIEVLQPADKGSKDLKIAKPPSLKSNPDAGFEKPSTAYSWSRDEHLHGALLLLNELLLLCNPGSL